MIGIALNFLVDELKTYINTQPGVDPTREPDSVQMTRVVDDTGKYAFEGFINASIINIEEERTFKSQVPDYNYMNGQHVVLEPELKLNLHVLFAANFTDYQKALKRISLVLTFFQTHHLFVPEQYPALDRRIGKLSAELQSLTYEQLNQVWAFIGGKQLPSVIYKIRLVTLQDKTIKAIQPPLKAIKTNIHGQ